MANQYHSGLKSNYQGSTLKITIDSQNLCDVAYKKINFFAVVFYCTNVWDNFGLSCISKLFHLYFCYYDTNRNRFLVELKSGHLKRLKILILKTEC